MIIGKQAVFFFTGRFSYSICIWRRGLIFSCGGFPVNPLALWQLMTPEFPEARAVPTFSLARLILHEMAVSGKIYSSFIWAEMRLRC